MCGILGFAGQHPIDADTLLAMTSKLSHRGPDDSGLWLADDRVAVVSDRRLAIIDLSAPGRQPMIDHAGRVHVAFNGEIYNYLELRAELQAAGHVFRTATDTE